MGPLNVEKNCKLTKRRTKTEKFEKSLKMYNNLIFKTNNYKLTASGNIHLMDTFKFMRLVYILRLPKE